MVKFGRSANGSFSVTKTMGQEFSTTLAWNINTEVKVEPGSRARAVLKLYEQSSIVDFTVRTRLSLHGPLRMLPVSMRRKGRHRNLKIYYVMNLMQFLGNYLNDYGKDPDTIVKMERVPREGSRISDEFAEITSRGVCHYVTCKKQHVEVEGSKIEDAPAEFADDLQPQ